MGGTRSGWGQSVVNVSSGRKRTEREKKKSASFQGRMTDPCVRSRSDKDATDGGQQMTTLKQAQESGEGEALSPADEHKLDSADDFKMTFTRYEQQTGVFLLRSLERERICLKTNMSENEKQIQIINNK